MTPEKFWKKVRIGKPDECWPWLGNPGERGYGRVRIHGATRSAARGAWTLTYGKPQHHILHTCDNPSCCNPAHLYDGTHYDNMRDRAQRGNANLPTGDQHYARANPEKLARGEGHGRAILSTYDVEEIRKLYATKKYTQLALAKYFGTARTTIQRILKGETWRHIP